MYIYIYHKMLEFLLNYTFGSVLGCPYRVTSTFGIYYVIEKQCSFLKQNWLAALTNLCIYLL